MKETLLKYLHLLIFFYGAWDLFGVHDEHLVLLKEIEDQIEPAQVQLEKIKKKVENIKENEEKLKRFEASIEEVKSQIRLLQKKMPPASEQTAVLQELTNTSKELNLKDVNFSPLPRLEKGLYFVNGIELKGKGTFLQFLIFFENVLRTERYFNIDKIVITDSPSENKGRFIFVEVNAAIQTFEYNEGYKEPSAPVVIPPPPPPPAAVFIQNELLNQYQAGL